MGTGKPSALLKKLTRSLTIRQRVAILTGGVIIAMGLALVLFINLTADSLQVTQIGAPMTMALVETADSEGNPITTIVETPAPLGYLLLREVYLIDPGPFSLIRTISIIGLLIFGLVGFFAAKWIATKSLQPLVQISRTAKQIDAHALNQRIGYHGSQDEVQDLADTIDAMLARLDENFEQQAQFSANLAHELRTPMTALRTNIEALAADPQATVEDYQALAETAERSLTRLERVVEDLLLISRGEKEIVYRPVYLAVLFEEILEDLAPLAQERGISLRMGGDVECEVRGEPGLLQRAFANLVENGILYNRPGGWVEIDMQRDEERIVVEVCDNGLGIRPEEQAKIFDRFYRGKSRAEDQPEGRGLGLAITRHLVELHHGSVEMESTFGVGSTFRVTLKSETSDLNF